MATAYDSIGKFDEHTKGLILVDANGLKGLIDKDGNIAISVKYSSIEKYGQTRKGWALVKNKEAKFGFIDADGKEVVPVIYDDIDSFREKPEEATEAHSVE